MTATPRDQVTAILLDAVGSGSDGTASGASSIDRLMPFVYDELHGMAVSRLRRDGADLTLSPTELVHEAYLRLADGSRVTDRGRAYFFAAAAHAMRRVIVDHARRRRRMKRGGGDRPITLNTGVALARNERVDVLDLENGLERLADLAERPARVVECRFYGGLSIDETALTLGVTARTVNRDWEFARAWLFDYLNANGLETRS